MKATNLSKELWYNSNSNIAFLCTWHDATWNQKYLLKIL